MYLGDGRQPAAVSTAIEPRSIRVEFGESAGSYRFAADADSARESLEWVLEAARPALTGKGPAVGIDLETTSLKPADGRIRLCQIGAGDRCVVLDCFAFDAWSVLTDAVAGREPEWIAHNAEFEQSWLARHGGFTLTPMFDTRWIYIREYARRTGSYEPGSSALDAVCADLLGFKLSKEQRLSDWTAPVLSFAQIEYAALDALVLPVLRERLERDAIDAGWTAEIEAATEWSAAEAARFL